MTPVTNRIPGQVLRGLGRSVRFHRNQANLTQKQLADQVGVWRGTIANIERGSQNPTYALLWLICEAMDTTVEIVLREAATKMV